MKPKTKMMAYSRLQSLQALKGAWQRLSMMLTLVVLTAMTSWAQTFGGGDGSAESPYMIYTVAQWDQMAELINQGGNYATAHYKLGADISGVTTMVGSQSKPFSGTFDGNATDGYTLQMPDDDATVSVDTETIRSTGQPVSVSYVNEYGTSDTHEAIALDGTMTTLAAGWYFVGSDIDYDQTVTLNGDANLILGDGYKMNIGSEHYLESSDCIKGNYTLTIYGQSGQTGTLNANKNPSKATICVGGYVQHGGIVNIDAKGNIAFFLSYGSTITGGTLNVVGDHDGNLTVSGGNVTIDGEIWGSATLGWKSVSDRIKVTTFSNTVNITKGQALADEDNGNNYAIGDGNALSDETVSSIAGKTLKPALLLTDNADNSAQIAAFDGQTTTAILQGRTLYRDGAWNTLCLPFKVSESANVYIHDAEIRCLDTSSKYNANGEKDDNGEYKTGQLDANGTMHIYFEQTDEIFANTPYIVKWNKPDGYDEANPDTRDIKDPVFTGVSVYCGDNTYESTSWENDSQYGNLSFVCTNYGPVAIPVDDKTRLFLGDDNKLYWPNATNHASFPYVTADTAPIVAISPDYGENTITYLTATSNLDAYYYIGPFRCYFRLNNGLTAGTSALQVHGFSIDFGEGETTGISLTPDPSPTGDGSDYYTFDGRKLSGKPTAKGVYIVNGRKVVMK